MNKLHVNLLSTYLFSVRFIIKLLILELGGSALLVLAK